MLRENLALGGNANGNGADIRVATVRATRPQQQPFGLAAVRAARGLAARAADLGPGPHRLQVRVQLSLVRGHLRPVQARGAVELGRHAQRPERREVGRRPRAGSQRGVAGWQLLARRHGQR